MNINSIRNKRDFLAHRMKGNTDILTIYEKKLGESFPAGQFLMDGFNVSYHFDKHSNGAGILLYIR